MSETRRVRFLRDYVVQDEHVGDVLRETRYQAGKVYELAPASADHFLDRGVAEPAPAKGGGKNTRAAKGKGAA